MFYSSYSGYYLNTAQLSLRHHINESYVLRGTPSGLSAKSESWLWSLILNAHTLGVRVGTPLAPLFADGLGRKASMIISTLVMALASCAEVVAIVGHLPELFLISRLIGSVLVAVRHVALLLLLIEGPPTHLRGLCSFIVGTVYSIGVGLWGS